MGLTATRVRIPHLPPHSVETTINSLTMRFIHFLTEAPQPKPPQQGDWIRKAAKADRQRARRSTKQRGDDNKQAMQANAQQPPGAVAGAGQPPKNNDVIQPPPGNFQKAAPPAQPKAPVDPALQPFLDAVKNNRPLSIELQTLLGAVYQTKRTNPQVQLSVPKLVTMSKNKELLQKLFDIVKDKDLPQLTAMFQEIKRSAALPGGGGQPAPNGMTNVPQTPGQTPAGKTMLQKLITLLKGNKNLSPTDIAVAQKELDKAKQNARPNPSPNAQQPIGKPVVTQG